MSESKSSKPDPVLAGFELVWAGLNKKGGGGIGPIRLEIAGFANSWNFDLDGFDQWETRDF